MTKIKKDDDFSNSSTISVISPSKLSSTLQSMVVETGISYIDAIVEYCDKNNIEVETIAPILTDSIKQIIAVEATTLNLLKDGYKSNNKRFSKLFG